MTPIAYKTCLCCDITYRVRRFKTDTDFCARCEADFERWEEEAEKEALEKMAQRIPDLDIKSPAIFRAIQAASAEGRLAPSLARDTGLDTGTFDCGFCGMLHFTGEEADLCCRPGVEEFEKTATDWQLERYVDHHEGVRT